MFPGSTSKYGHTGRAEEEGEGGGGENIEHIWPKAGPSVVLASYQRMVWHLGCIGLP